MSHSFLLDENILAIAFRKPVGGALWRNIALNCHAIVVSPELHERYWAKIKLRRQQASDNETTDVLVRLLNLLLRHAEKSIWVVPGEPWHVHTIAHHRDWFLEPIAAAFYDQHPTRSPCFFVSMDRSTREAFNRPTLAALGFVGMRLEEGVERSAERAADCP